MTWVTLWQTGWSVTSLNKLWFGARTQWPDQSRADWQDLPGYWVFRWPGSAGRPNKTMSEMGQSVYDSIWQSGEIPGISWIFSEVRIQAALCLYPSLLWTSMLSLVVKHLSLGFKASESIPTPPSPLTLTLTFHLWMETPVPLLLFTLLLWELMFRLLQLEKYFDVKYFALSFNPYFYYSRYAMALYNQHVCPVDNWYVYKHYSC